MTITTVDAETTAQAIARRKGYAVALLATTGLSPIDISTALRIDLAQVREMIAATGDEAAQLHREAWR